MIAQDEETIRGLVLWPVSLSVSMLAQLESLAVRRGVGRSGTLRDCLYAALAVWQLEGGL